MRFLTVSLMSLCLFFSFAGAAYAEETETDMSPYVGKIKTAAVALLETLNEEQVNHMAVIKESSGMIRAVRIVRTDVSKAVESCGKENESIKAEMDERFKGWNQAVTPVLEGHEKAMDESIMHEGRFKDPEQIKSYISLIDEAAKHAESKIEKIPVTTEEACQSLLKSMDRTQEKLVDLLKEIAWLPEGAAPDSGASP